MGVDLRTTYLGLELRNPVVASASPLTGHVEILRRMEEAGVAAVVMPSLFEEQFEREELFVRRLLQSGTGPAEGAPPRLVELDSYNAGPANYLEQIAKAKKALAVPVIASLNGAGPGDWARHARLLEEAGADAVELDIYFVPSDPDITGAQVEQHYLEIVSTVQEALTVPLSVKLGPYFSSLPNMARRLVEEVGVEGLVLFNRYLYPDIALETLQIGPRLTLSKSMELPMSMRWIGILRPRLSASLAASTGVHTADDVFKLLLVGADVAMTTSALLRHGPEYIGKLVEGLQTRLEEKGFASVGQIKGILSQRNCADPSAFERANYVKTIASSTPFRDGLSD